MNPVFRFDEVRLRAGGNQSLIPFNPGLNLVVGPIGTGKSTLVRLLRSVFGRIPRDLPPEVRELDDLQATVRAGDRELTVTRAMGTSPAAEVGVSDGHAFDPWEIRLPVRKPGADLSSHLISLLGLPAAIVPDRRGRAKEGVVPVEFGDWLTYCAITDDEMDTQVFGHRDRDDLRRWLFDIIYGYYVPGVVEKRNRIRVNERRLRDLKSIDGAMDRLLAGATIEEATDPIAHQTAVAELSERLRELGAARENLRQRADDVPGAVELRMELLAGYAEQARLTDELARVEREGRDLEALAGRLRDQYTRLTRAIVAGERFVDLDFVLCPRCGTSVQPDRADDAHCYLCLQPSTAGPTPDELLAEQYRLVAQMEETTEVRSLHGNRAGRLRTVLELLRARVGELERALDQLSRTFVSEEAARIERLAAEEAGCRAELAKLHEARGIVERRNEALKERDRLKEEVTRLKAEVAGSRPDRVRNDANVRALEGRLTEYLDYLRFPLLDSHSGVSIGAKDRLPVISRRRFEAISSQGLKTLANIAHALAHHTVAIDRGLPLPGLLILDGVSANTGHEGYDVAAVGRVYALLHEVAARYREHLQIIVVDAELPRGPLPDDVNIAITLSEDSKLIPLPDPLF